MDHDTPDVPEDSPQTPRGFHILYEKTLPHRARPGLAEWSPQLDLIVLVTANENVLLYRMNGQRVWGFAPKHVNESTIQHLHWRPDGKMLALGYSDGSTRIHDVNNGKPIHRIASEVPGFGKVTCVGWVDNHSHSKQQLRVPEALGECTPQGLFDLDLGQMLPRLSALPTSLGPESTFSSKATLDALVNAVAKGNEVNHLDVLLIGEQGGKILLNVYNSFVIGTIELTSLSHHIAPGTKLIRHTASHDLSTHSLLLTDSQDNLLFSTMDILFIQQFGQYLFQLASISTRVHATIRYIRETVTALESEFKTMNDLAQKYVNIIDEDAKKVGSDVGLELFELLVTGLPTEVLREWLVDVLQERNQKRWEKNSVSGYESLRKLVHENLLPACERLTVLFCRLRGLARWKERGSPLGLDPDDFTRCLDVVSGLTVFAHDFISKLNKELELFTAFASWLRHTLDELSTINAEEKTEDPQIDTLKVAEYVSGYLHQSSLQLFFQRGAAMKLSEYKENGESIFELYSKGEKTDKGQGGNPPGFMELAQYLDELCKMVFAKPQQAMRQQLRACKPILIAEKEPVKGDVRMVDENGKVMTYMAFYHGEDSANTLVLIRCEIAVTGGLSTVANIGCAKMLLSHDPDSRLVDLQFVDDGAVILIVAHKGADAQTREMLTAIYNTASYDFNYDAEDLAESVCSYAEGLPGLEMKILNRRTFDASFVPAQVTVNGNKGRRVGCVIGEDQVRYKVFDIDQEEPDEEAQEEEEEIEEQEEEMEVDDER